MAKISATGFEALAIDMEKLANLPKEAADDMLKSGGEIIKKAQEKQIDAFRLVRTGAMKKSIAVGKARHNDDGSYSCSIYPKGKDEKGTRNAEKGFIAEYGKTNQPPKPWMRTANEQSEDSAIAAMEKVYDEKVSKI